ncbi:MAG: hypothetical protein ACREED_00005, partial [Stellaceae bacterium]
APNSAAAPSAQEIPRPRPQPSASADDTGGVTALRAGRKATISNPMIERHPAKKAARLGMRLVIAIVIGFAISGCTSSIPRGPTVQPGHVFPGNNLTVTWPESDGWHLSVSHRGQWIFARQGTSPGEIYIAVISWIDVPSALAPQDFVAFVKRFTDADIGGSRYKTLESTAEYSSEREYPCVRYRATSVDTQPQTIEPGWRTPLPLEAESLTCENPLLKNVAFAVAYSHDGNHPDPNFHGDAANLFAGVQVPGH